MKAHVSLPVVGLLLLFCAGGSCLNPCQQVADKVCACEVGEPEKQACRRQVQVQSGQTELTPQQRLNCQAWLTTCECRELEKGNLKACGLARE